MGIRIALAVALTGAAVAATPASAIDIQEVTSPGGIDFLLVEEPSIPIASVEISFRGGARLDPEDKPGVANMMAGLVTDGAGDMDALAFSKALSDLSVRLGVSAGRDEVSVSARFLTDRTEDSLALIATALADPRFDDEPVERSRAQILSSLREAETDPDTIASRAWYARAFPDHPYGTPATGTIESVTALTRDDLVEAHSRHLTRESAIVAVVGALDAEMAGAAVDQIMGGLPDGEPVEATPEAWNPPAGLEVVDLDVPQSVAIFGQQGLVRDDPDFIPAFVMNHILGGGGFNSRLMKEVRVNRGLAYGVYSYLAARDEAALYLGSVSTANARMSESIDVIRAEWEKMATEGPTEEELEKAKTYLTGAFPLRFDSNAKIANYLVFVQQSGLGVDYINERNGLIDAVTLDDVKRVAGRLLDPEALSITVVGRPAGL